MQVLCDAQKKKVHLMIVFVSVNLKIKYTELYI